MCKERLPNKKEELVCTPPNSLLDFEGGGGGECSVTGNYSRNAEFPCGIYICIRP